MDSRLLKFTAGWSAWEIYKGKKVIIPDSWILHKFEFDGEGDIERAEKQVWLALGWEGYDAEAIVALGIFAENVHVQAEITRLGGAEIHVLYNGKEVVKFPRYLFGVAKGYYVIKMS